MLSNALTAIGLISVSFVATNIDNLALLVGWMLDERTNRRHIRLGHLLGMFTLLIMASAFGLGANLLSLEHVGYIGLLPIGLGLKGLYDLLRARLHTAPKPLATGHHSGPLSIAAIQIANGVDTVLILGPLLADSEFGVDLVMMAGFLAMVFIWFELARFLESHMSRLSLLNRYGQWIAPIVMIVIGFYILADTATDIVPGQ